MSTRKRDPKKGGRRGGTEGGRSDDAPDEPARQRESAVRSRILREAWAMIEAGRLDELTMATVARAAGTSRQTVYVQFGSRAGLLVQMVRERDAENPRGRRAAAAIAKPDPVESVQALTRVLAGWWRDIHPIAQALYAAAVSDEAARAAWSDRMAHLHEICRQAVGRLADADLLAPGWDRPTATDWLATQLNPIGWVMLVEESGWIQGRYEARLAKVVRSVLVAEGRSAP